ncbi:MAG: hypothetical protein HS120_06265 [Burkholderiales bacterium]|nr:hypothetical protein [Burkholderiales bacterium]
MQGDYNKTFSGLNRFRGTINQIENKDKMHTFHDKGKSGLRPANHTRTT